MPLHWNTDLEIGILELDVQQQELFTKFELFSDEIEKEHGHNEVGKFIKYLDHYVQEHFKYEEHMQERSNFPERAKHLAEHRRFVEELDGLKAAHHAGKDAVELCFALKGMMIRWIITHGKHTDLVFNNYLMAASEEAKQELISKKLGEILVRSQVVSAVAIERALAKQKETGMKLGLILVGMGIVSMEEITAALLAQEGKSIFTEKLGHILVESGLIAYETLERALESQKLSGKLVGAVLVEMGVLDLEEVIYAQAVQKGMLQREAVA